MSEIQIPYITELIHYSEVIFGGGSPAATATLVYQNKSLAVVSGRIVENTRVGYDAMGGTQTSLAAGVASPESFTGLFVESGQLYAKAGTRTWAVWLRYFPEIVQNSITWAHPGQQPLLDPTRVKRLILNRGPGIFAGNLRLGELTKKQEDIASVYESFFFFLDQQANWAWIPTSRPAVPFTSLVVSSTTVVPTGVIATTPGVGQTKGGQWCSNGKRIFKVQYTSGNDLILWPPVDITGDTLRPARAVRAVSSTNRPVVTRKTGEGFSGWTWGWEEFVG